MPLSISRREPRRAPATEMTAEYAQTTNEARRRNEPSEAILCSRKSYVVSASRRTVSDAVLGTRRGRFVLRRTLRDDGEHQHGARRTHLDISMCHKDFRETVT